MDKEFINMVAELLKIDSGLLAEDSTAATIPEWDSLNHWMIIGEMEDKYGVELSLDEAIGFKNLGEIYNAIKRKIE